MNKYSEYKSEIILNNLFLNFSKYNLIDNYQLNDIKNNIIDFLGENLKDKKKIVDLSRTLIEKTCQYVYIKGDKKGDKCGRCIRNKNQNRGHNLCATHLKTIDSEKLFKLPQPRISPECIVLENEPTLNKLWHQESGIVFENKKAIGRYHHRIFFPITHEIIKICDIWNFEY
jgi:hypothetical protein